MSGRPDTAGPRFTWLGHSTVLIELGGQRLLTDPLLLPHNGLLRRAAPPPRPAHWSGVDAVLLSHLHHDHAELRSLRLVDAPVLTSASSARWLRSHHLDGRGIADWSELGPLEVRLVEADHAGRPMPHRPNVATGHLLRHPTATVWVAGDTSLYADMARLPALAGVPRLDVAVVPVGGWGPRLPIEHHMGPDEAAQACALTEARYALPVHWGTLHLPLTRRWGDWFERAGEVFEAAARATAPGCRVIRLSVGESWSMPMPADDAGAS